MSSLDQDRKAKAVLNEQIKLAATYLNGLAVAIFIVIGAAPMFAAGLRTSAELVVDPALVTLVCSGVASVALHLTARAILKRIEP